MEQQNKLQHNIFPRLHQTNILNKFILPEAQRFWETSQQQKIFPLLHISFTDICIEYM